MRIGKFCDLYGREIGMKNVIVLVIILNIFDECVEYFEGRVFIFKKCKF